MERLAFEELVNEKAGLHRPKQKVVLHNAQMRINSVAQIETNCLDHDVN